MKTYETVTEALSDLSQRGYTLDFSLLADKDCIHCSKHGHTLQVDEFVIDEIHRFDADSDPNEEVVIYAISSPVYNLKGTLLNAFGMYSDAHKSQLIEKLNFQNKTKSAPIKRAKELIQLSREHHHGLLLGWKIKSGLSKGIEIERISAYVLWFYSNHLLPHFELEEKYIFSLLDAKNENRILAERQHKEIKHILDKVTLDKEDLVQLEKTLNEHIRFEERTLFNEIQQTGLLSNLIDAERLLEKFEFIDNETDPFWK